MDLYTKVEIPKSSFSIDYRSKLMFCGSCFAENISQFFLNAKFNCLVNPSGIVYNPLSLKLMFDAVLSQKKYTEDDFFFDGTYYNNYDFHGSFSDSDLQKALCDVNESISNAYNFLSSTDIIFITLGTSFVCFLKSNSKPVSNCHKQNANLFLRRIISVSEVSETLISIVNSVKQVNPKVKFVFTVSPIRHFRDDAHFNQLSKSTLHLGIHETISKLDNCEYFPSYEIVQDELRDYRFYDDDMIHVSPLAEKIIWCRIQQTFFSSETQNSVQRVEKFMQSVRHRVQNPCSEQTKMFANKNISLAKLLESEIQGLNLTLEIKYFHDFCC